jgi:thiamine pyrophosphokinase
MLFDISQVKGPFVLFGNGESPTHKIPTEILKNARTILCTDGGANKLKNIGLQPDLILGDFDSISDNSFGCEIIKLVDQSKTDLEKSLDWCKKNGITKLDLVGFSGEQDDHNMAALWTLITYHDKMSLTFYSNFSEIKCVKSKTKFDSFPGQIISIIPTRENIGIRTTGLKYPINNSVLEPPSFGTRNSANGNEFSIQTTGPVWVFLNYKDGI